MKGFHFQFNGKHWMFLDCELVEDGVTVKEIFLIFKLDRRVT